MEGELQRSRSPSSPKIPPPLPLKPQHQRTTFDKGRDYLTTDNVIQDTVEIKQ